jgi:branched-chain amino acid transport system ATP-binding protein
MIMDEKKTILEINKITVHYGQVQALSGVTIHIRRGEIVALLGANATGKSTLLCSIAGIRPITDGEILFDGSSISNSPAEQIVKLGVTLVPEGRLLFNAMKTIENLELGAYCWWGRGKKEEMKRNLSNVFKLFPVLREKKDQVTGMLSGGQQQMVAIGRGLMSRPQLLLLDEPCLGLAPVLVKELMGALLKLKEQGLTILLSEQNAAAALNIADHGYVMGGGKVVLEGSGRELLSTDKVKVAYLGL